MHGQTHPFPCTVQIAFVLLARSGAPGETRTPDPPVRRKAVKNSNLLLVSLPEERAIYLALELDRSWTEMTYTVRRQLRKQHESKTSDWIWATTLPPAQVPVDRSVHLGHQ
jgi:hypothetical protein